MNAGCRCCGEMLTRFQEVEDAGEVDADLAFAAYSFAGVCRAYNDAPCIWARTLSEAAYDWLVGFSLVAD